MMVLFVSQCEKRALIRTRRVLDTFANRLGNTTWQTVITQEGLDAVEKLLKKTATKNTAVSCHWIRSRSRIQLTWIVGSLSKFSHAGIVPVNYTQKDILMKYNECTQEIYANTNKQKLKHHLFAVGYLAHAIITKLYPDAQKKLALVAYTAGIWHDIGKLDPQYQKWLKKLLGEKTPLPTPEDGLHINALKFSFNQYPRHNEISLILFELFDKLDNGKFKTLLNNDTLVCFCKHAIYWHHAKPIRKQELISQKDIYKQFKGKFEGVSINDILNQIHQIINLINEQAKKYGCGELNIDFELKLKKDSIFDDTFSSLNIPEYKEYSSQNSIFRDYKEDVRNNCKKSILRAAIISADRKISSLDAETLTLHIQNKTLDSLIGEILDLGGSNLSLYIKNCLERFTINKENEKRNEKQNQVAERLKKISLRDIYANNHNITVLRGPAGCGKTKIALEWALKTNVQKIIWVCPRVQVCLGLYEELSSDQYLPEASIELLTGEFQKIKQNGKEKDTEESEKFSGDIVITTVDQVINTIITHQQVCTFIDFLNSHVVFDEFHELIKIPALNLLFAELVEAKKLRSQEAKTLLVSATPNPFFVTKFLDIPNGNIIEMPTFNKAPYQIKLIPYDEIQEESPLIVETHSLKNTFVISNAAIDAQRGFIRHQVKENAILIHGRFMKGDKLNIFKDVYRAFKRDGTREFDILRAGPIIQASLNITCNKMVTEITSPENWLQRLGRLDRFGQNCDVNVYTTYIPKSIYDNGKQTSAVARFLNKIHDYYAAHAWLEFLKMKLQENGQITLEKLYKLYEDFYQDKKSLEKVQEDLETNLRKSVWQLKKLHDPIAFPVKKKAETNIKIKSSSLRGDSRFVQMAVVEYDECGQHKILNQYACDSENLSNQFTMSVDEMQGYDEGGDANLISEMHKKHHKIMKAKKEKYTRRYRSSFLKNEARDPRFPIFLSYTKEDLALCDDKAHEDAIYYVYATDSAKSRQPIGAISIKNLNSIKELKSKGE